MTCAPVLRSLHECVPGSPSCEQNEIVSNARARLEACVLFLKDRLNDRQWLVGFLGKRGNRAGV